MPDDLEQELRALAAHLDTGAPADQRAAVRARLTAPAPVPFLRRSWARALVVLAAVLAVLLTFEPARAVIADAVGGVLRVAGIEVRREPPPGGLPVTPVPVPSLRTADLDTARQEALFPVRVPAQLGPPARVQLADPGPDGKPRVVTLLYGGGTTRLDEIDGGVSPAFFKSAPEARWTTIGTGDGIWVPQPHPVTYVGRDGVEHTATARLAGPTLIWTDGVVTYRLEGVADLDRARDIALSLR